MTSMTRMKGWWFIVTFLLFLLVESAKPTVVFADSEEEIKDLQQRIETLEAMKKEETAVDVSGFIRYRYHVSNFTDYGLLNTFDFQTQPPDKSVADKNNAANYAESRTRVYITPKIGDYIKGQMAFELDYRAGDSAYAVGANKGGGLEADQVNIETKNLNFTVKFPDTKLSGTFGLQNIADPYGGILLGWADTSGVTLNYKAADNINALVGWYRFWQPAARLKKSVAADFWRTEVAYAPSKDLNLGFNLYALLDRTGIGATSDDPGALGGDPYGSANNGFAPLTYNVSTGHESLVGNTDYSFNVAWPGVNFNYKSAGYTFDGFFIYEAGKFVSRTPGIDDVNVSSFASTLGVSTDVGPFNVKLSGLYVTGDNSDQNAAIGIKEGGFYTPGSYSLAGAWMGLTGMKILFPDIDATNQDQYLVYDVTNTYEQKPLGIKAVMLTGKTQLSKNVNLETGIGALYSEKKRAVNDSSAMATEVNAGVYYSPYKSFRTGLVGAYAWVGDFYKVSDAQATAFNATKAGNPVVANRDPANMWRVYATANYSF
jgi:hypothetical protein